MRRNNDIKQDSYLQSLPEVNSFGGLCVHEHQLPSNAKISDASVNIPQCASGISASFNTICTGSVAAQLLHCPTEEAAVVGFVGGFVPPEQPLAHLLPPPGAVLKEYVPRQGHVPLAQLYQWKSVTIYTHIVLRI